MCLKGAREALGTRKRQQRQTIDKLNAEQQNGLFMQDPLVTRQLLNGNPAHRLSTVPQHCLVCVRRAYSRAGGFLCHTSRLSSVEMC